MPIDMDFTSTRNAPVTETVYFHNTTNGVINEVTKVTTVAADGLTSTIAFQNSRTGVAYTPVVTDVMSTEKLSMSIGAAVSLAVPSGATAVQLATPPGVADIYGTLWPQAAFISVQADPQTIASGIAYRVDGAIPTTAIESEIGLGKGMWLRSRAEILGFRAMVISGNGELYTTAGQTVTLTVQYFNFVTPEG